MAPVEVDVIPYDIMAPVKNLKAVIKAFELPLVTSAYNEIATIDSLCGDHNDYHHSHHLGTTAIYGSFESAIKTANAGSFVHTKKCG